MAPRTRRREREEEGFPSSLLKLAAADALVTGFWVLGTSLLAEVGALLLTHQVFASLGQFAVDALLLVTALILMDVPCRIVGGNFNPVNILALMLTKRASIPVGLLRIAAECAGAMAGGRLAVRVVPISLQGKFQNLAGGLKQGVTLADGAVCEAFLAAASVLVFLAAQDSSGKKLSRTSKLIHYWGPLAATVLLVWVGTFYTGPLMNPAVALAWNTTLGGVDDHWLLYVAAPFLGTALAVHLYKMAVSWSQFFPIRPRSTRVKQFARMSSDSPHRARSPRTTPSPAARRRAAAAAAKAAGSDDEGRQEEGVEVAPGSAHKSPRSAAKSPKSPKSPRSAPGTPASPGRSLNGALPTTTPKRRGRPPKARPAETAPPAVVVATPHTSRTADAGEGGVPNTVTPGRKRGRPSNAEIAARLAAEASVLAGVGEAPAAAEEGGMRLRRSSRRHQPQA